MLDLKALLSKILGCCYIKGTSGNWTYKKYLDGTLECWYYGNTGAYTCGTARGNMYAGGWLTYTFPITFTHLDCVFGSATLTTDAYTVLAQLPQPLTNSVKLRITSGSSVAQNNYRVHIYANGTWGGVINTLRSCFVNMSILERGWIYC